MYSHPSYLLLLSRRRVSILTEYCFYVYEQKKMRAHNYTIDVDKLRKHLMELYVQNQGSQNVLAFIPF
jgi:hypothetical protein